MVKHMDTEFDKTFEPTAELKGFNLENLSKIPFMDMLKILQPLVLVEVPESFAHETEKRRLDYLLARLANVHAYLRFMWAAATYERARLKRIGTDSAEDMAKKKEALYELGNAVKLKYEAVSRKITLELEGEGDPKVVERRSYSPPENTTNAAQTAFKKGGKGGWGNVG